jgi:Mitochondria-eating protein
VNRERLRCISVNVFQTEILYNDLSGLFRLSEQAQRQIEKGSTKFEDLSLGNMRPTQLIRRYGNLYSEGRLDALDALDDIPEMSNFDDLKGKLLLTILVVSMFFSKPTSNCCFIMTHFAERQQFFSFQMLIELWVINQH